MKTALFICRCGPHISDYIDLDSLKLRISDRRPFVVIFDGDFLCAEDGKEELRSRLLEVSPERVVIAACSPCDQQMTFAAVLEGAGINRGFLQIANIREQVAWITPDIGRSTEKALRTILAAIDRVKLHEPLARRSIRVSTDLLVLGAGPAGLTAAHNLAAAGRRVILLERGAAVGGEAVRQEHLQPSGECGACLMHPLIDQVLEDERAGRIELLTMAEVEACRGFFGNFVVTVRQTGLQIDRAACIGCAACIEHCPVTTPAGRKALDMVFPGAQPNVPVIAAELCLRFHGEECTACRDACPLGEGVVSYERMERCLEFQVGGIVIGVGANSGNSDQLARRLGAPMDAVGNFRPAHPGLDPVRSSMRGIYLAGACSGGYGVGQAALQGLAASGAALADLLPDGMVALEGPVAMVMAQYCSGCRICIGLCPYHAIEMDKDNRCLINDVLCRGCGACSAACPAGAIKLQQYSREQLEAELRGLLDREAE